MKAVSVSAEKSPRKLKPVSVSAKATKPKQATKPKPAKKAPAKPAPRARAKRPAPPANKRPRLKRARVLSREPEAVRSRTRRAEAKLAELAAKDRKNAQARKRRADARAVAEAAALEAARKREGQRAKRQRKKKPPSIPGRTTLDEAIAWLEYMRNEAAHLYPISLEVTNAEPGAKTPWLVVGRFDLIDAVSYSELGEIFQLWADDLALEVMIHPERLSQIRIVYTDPNDPRGSSDSIVSSIGAWQYVVADLVGDLIGVGEDDEDSLAVRYANTKIGTFFVYFAPDLVTYNVVGPWASRPATLPKSGPGSTGARTYTIKLR